MTENAQNLECVKALESEIIVLQSTRAENEQEVLRVRSQVELTTRQLSDAMEASAKEIEVQTAKIIEIQTTMESLRVAADVQERENEDLLDKIEVSLVPIGHEHNRLIS